MADLSKIKIPNGTEYNLKDAQARADIESLNGSLGDVKADLTTLTEMTVLDAEYRQGYLTTNGAYNTSNSGKSYAFDIDGMTDAINIKMSSNNILRYAFYSKARSEVTSADTGIGYTIVSTSPHEFVFEKSIYGTYKTLIVSTDYNNSNPTSIIAFAGFLKSEMQKEINDLDDGNKKNIVSLLHMEAGTINATTGNNESSTTRIRSSEFLPPFSGNLSTTDSDGGFYLYAWESSTFKGGWTGETFGSSVKQKQINVGAISRAYPAYTFKIVYLIDNGTATIDDVSNIILTNIFYPADNIPVEKIRVMFNNLGGFNFGTYATGSDRMSTADALEKMEAYKQFYKEYQPNILALEEYPMDTSKMSKYIDKGDSVCPDTDLYPFIYPYTTTPYQYATIKSDLYIHYQRGLAVKLDGYSYGIRGTLASVITPEGRNVGIISTVFDVNGTAENRTAQMNKAIELLSSYEYGFLCVDTNMLSSAEFDAMKTLFTSSGYQLLNGDFYPLMDTCPGAVYKPIDNIMVKGNVKIKSFVVPDVITELSSDHLPVIGDFLLY